MKNIKNIFVFVFLLSFYANANAQSALAAGGKLKVVDKQLSSECDKPIQLRGMSTHGIQWFKDCYNEQALDSLVNDWGIDVLRIVTYIQSSSQGYNSDPAWFKNKVDELVDLCAEKGIYCIIDWHVHTKGNPLASLEESKEFWEYMSKKHAGKKHVLYEICNEPNNDENGNKVPWSDIKEYAEEIIPIIRANDPQTVIIVGTPSWSGNPWEVVGNELTGDNAYNVMYTFHFYAGSHSSKKGPFRNVIKQIPIFVTEWGTSDASGNDNFSEAETRNWIDIFNGDNEEGIKISWVNWSFADKNETSAALTPGACATRQYNSTSESGTLLRELLTTPEDNFLACSDEPQIITGLQNVIINEGQDAVFKINATGPDLVYTWFRNSEEIPDESTSELIIENATIEDNLDEFYVVISNAEGFATSNTAIMTVNPKGPYSGSPIAIPGRLEVEEYDIGGPGDTYFDTDEGNNGNEFRFDDVDISGSGDEDDGYSIGWTNTGEWLEYTVDIEETDEYTFQFRNTNLDQTGVVSISIDGQNVISRQAFEPTGGWNSWVTTSVSGVDLEEGEHTLRLTINTGPINLNYINILKSSDISGIFDRTYDTQGIMIYPNPVNGTLNIKSESISLNHARIQILDMTGVPVLQAAENQNTQMNVNNLEPGMYMLRITNGGQEIYLKWVKN